MFGSDRPPGLRAPGGPGHVTHSSLCSKGLARDSVALTSWRVLPRRVSREAGALASGTMGASEAEPRPLLDYPRALPAPRPSRVVAMDWTYTGSSEKSGPGTLPWVGR